MIDLLNALPTPENSTLEGWPWTTSTSPAVYEGEESWPKITIITPSFNQGEFIEETIRSVLLQNYPNLEYIIIDGGSTDNSVDIIKKYDKWLSYWVSEPDRGQSHAINKGLEKATGEIINWLNSDDFYCKEALFEVGRILSTDSYLGITGPSWVFGINNRQLEGTPIFESLDKTISAARTNQPTTFYKSNVFKSITPLNENLHYMMDLHMWLRFLIKFDANKIYRTKEVLVNFREHVDSKTISSEQLFFQERFFLLGALQKHISNKALKKEEENLFVIKDLPTNKKKLILTGINDTFFLWTKKHSNAPSFLNISLIDFKYLKSKDKLIFLHLNFSLYMREIIKKTVPSLLLEFYRRLKQYTNNKKIKREWIRNNKPSPPPHVIKENHITTVQKKFKYNYFVETGTYKGQMIKAQSRFFRQLYSIELSEKLYFQARDKFKNKKSIEIIHGDSAEQLPLLLEKLNDSIIFWLDGHYDFTPVTAKGQKVTPIYEELESISKRNYSDVILIDDARLFINAKDNDHYPTFEALKSFIQIKLPNHSIKITDDIIFILPNYE